MAQLTINNHNQGGKWFAYFREETWVWLLLDYLISKFGHAKDEKNDKMKMAQTWTQVRGIRKHTSGLGKLGEAVCNDQTNVTSQTEDQGLNATSTTYQQMNFPEHHFCFF